MKPSDSSVVCDTQQLHTQWYIAVRRKERAHLSPHPSVSFVHCEVLNARLLVHLVSGYYDQSAQPLSHQPVHLLSE